MMIDEQSARKAVQTTPTVSREVALRAVNLDPFLKWKGRQACLAAAKAKPLPGAAGHAFTSGDIKIAGKVVHRCVPAHFAVLQAISSPLLVMMEEAASKKEVRMDFKPQEQWEMALVFTEDAEAMYDLLESEGVKAIKQKARKEIGMKWEPASVNLVIVAILEQIKRHVETTVKFSAEAEKDGQISFFREPTPTP